MTSRFYTLGLKSAAAPFAAGAVPQLAPPPTAPKTPQIPKVKPGQISQVIQPPSLKGSGSGLGGLPNFGGGGSAGGGGQKAAQYKLSRRMKFRGLNISVETDKGEQRHWHDPHNGEKGSTTMQHPYGYIRRTEGVDGDHVDVYVGPNEDAKNVYIVHQMKAPKFTQYDEDKCMLGFDSAADAKKAYLAHYNDDRFFGKMRTLPFEEFKKRALKTFERPAKIAEEQAMNEHLKHAYQMGAQCAHAYAMKLANENLGDPNFWQGGTPSPEEQAAPASAEEALSALPAGSFQGMQTKITPDGQKSTSVKVSPDVLAAPEGLAGMFQSGEDVKVEIANPQANEAAAPMPGVGSDAGIPPEGAGELPPEAAGKMAALQQMGIMTAPTLSTLKAIKSREIKTPSLKPAKTTAALT